MAMLLVCEITSCKLNNHESSTSDKRVCHCFKCGAISHQLLENWWLLKRRILLKTGLMVKVHKKKIV
jgi:hypothetical protein